MNQKRMQSLWIDACRGIQNRSTRRETYPIDTFFTTNPTEPALRREIPATNRLDNGKFICKGKGAPDILPRLSYCTCVFVCMLRTVLFPYIPKNIFLVVSVWWDTSSYTICDRFLKGLCYKVYQIFILCLYKITRSMNGHIVGHKQTQYGFQKSVILSNNKRVLLGTWTSTKGHKLNIT
jgi:hypothetical protein